MTTRATAAVAWSMCGLSVVAAAAGEALFMHSGHPAGAGPEPVDRLQSVSHVVFSVVGAWIASRRPSNAVGWLLSASGLASTLGLNGFGYGYAYASLEGPSGPLPATNWVAWLVAWLQPFSIGTGTLAFQLFPSGRPLSRRWRPLTWLTVGLSALAMFAQALRPGPFDNIPLVENPLGLFGSPGELVSALQGATNVGPLMLLLAVPALLVRFWRSRGAERQQLKWVVYAGAVVPIYFSMLVGASLLLPDILLSAGSAANFLFWTLGWTAAIATLPVSIGIAILRYRLYDIDLIIRRTLIYGVLTAFLALVYWVGVVVLQQLLRPVTQGSDLAIVGSTLAVAALFQPLRQRIQVVVDRRFYRQRYDAARTLETFSGRLRDQLDLEALGSELETVVQRTMQPQQLSLWLRPLKVGHLVAARNDPGTFDS